MRIGCGARTLQHQQESLFLDFQQTLWKWTSNFNVTGSIEFQHSSRLRTQVRISTALTLGQSDQLSQITLELLKIRHISIPSRVQLFVHQFQLHERHSKVSVQWIASSLHSPFHREVSRRRFCTNVVSVLSYLTLVRLDLALDQRLLLL